MEHYRSDESSVFFGSGTPSAFADRPSLFLDRVTGVLHRNLGNGSTWSGILGSAGGTTLVVDSVFGTSSGARQGGSFATLAQAKAASAAGDLTAVRAGTYNETNLGKTGGTFNWEFPAGANVTYTGNIAGIFDDGATGSNADLVQVISGFGSFTSTGNFPAFHITRAGSTLEVEANQINATQDADTGQPYCVFGAGGVMRIRAARMTSPQTCLYWWDGDAEVEVGEIIQTGATTGTQRAAIQTVEAGGSGGSKWHVNSKLVTAVGQAVIFESAHATNRLWLTSQRIYGVEAGVHLSGTAGVCYVTAQKVESITNGTSTYGAVCVLDSSAGGGGGTLHLTVQKLEGGAPGLGVISINDSVSYITVLDELVDTGLANEPAITVNGGTTDLTIARLKRTTNGHGIELTGGTTRLTDSYIDVTGATAKSAIRGTSAATLTLRGVELKTPSTTACITSSDASAFVVNGHFTANNLIGANVTATSGYTLAIASKTEVEITPVGTIANLPTGAAGLIGARSFVTNGGQTMAANIGAVVSGTGANAFPVYYDGTNWRIG